jgi:hypothetical protein
VQKNKSALIHRCSPAQEVLQNRHGSRDHGKAKHQVITLYGLDRAQSEICRKNTQLFNLETAIGREKDVQDIDVHGEFEKRVVTLLVMSAFS